MMYLLVYVDDIILIGNQSSLLHTFTAQLLKQFSFKDLGALSYVLGVEMFRSPSGFILAQRKYISDLLHRTNMHDAKEVSTPLSSSETHALTMGLLAMIQLNIVKFLGVFNISLSLCQMCLMLSINLLNSYITLLLFIGLQWSESFAISKVPFIMAFCFSQSPLWLFTPSLMLTGPVMLTLVTPLMLMLCFLALILLVGALKNRPLLLDLLPRLNTVLLLLLLPTSTGLPTYSVS